MTTLLGGYSQSEVPVLDVHKDREWATAGSNPTCLQFDQSDSGIVLVHPVRHVMLMGKEVFLLRVLR